MIKILNTLSGQKEEFVPHKGKNVNMFVCGPTVYDYIHIGNARTFVFFDVVSKYLRHKGYDIDYIQNITDIDDKIIQRANENGRDPLEWAREYEDKFLEDMEKIGVTGVSRYARATEHIEQMVKQVKTLIDKGHAYFIEGEGYYFDLKTFPEYGKLSKRTAQMADDGVSRIDESDKKRNAGDFALWKLSKPNEPAWDTELGKGRPGWHIEDTAITEHYFGPQYDIHGGGQDLIFPHHEAEITQQEAASGKSPFVNYWIHVAFLINKERKMSKTLGNFTTARDLLEKYPKEVLRFYLLSGHYKQPLEFSEQILKQTQEEVDRINIFWNDLNSADGNENTESQVIKFQKQFFEAMDNDFNTPDAFAALFGLIRNLNPKLKYLDKKSVEKTKIFFKEADSILGIIPTIKVPAEIQEELDKMVKLRREKKYKESDEIRTNLENRGFIIKNITQEHSTVIAGVELKNK